jgi:hypothetical protein
MLSLGALATKSGCIKVWNVIFQYLVKKVAKSKLSLPDTWKRAGAESRRGRSSEVIFRKMERRRAVLEKLGKISFPRFRWERKAEIISGEEGGGQ